MRQVGLGLGADTGRIGLGLVDGFAKVRADRVWLGRVKSEMWFVKAEFARVRKMTM